MRGAEGVWEPGARQWLVKRRRIGPVIRELERTVDPLFRWAGFSLTGWWTSLNPGVSLQHTMT
jgi:hypothetical protein